MVGGLMNHAFGIFRIYMQISYHRYSALANYNLALELCVAMLSPQSGFWPIIHGF